MPSQTTNYNLNLYDKTADSGSNFIDFRDDVAGSGSNSNMVKIDNQMKVNTDAISNLAGTGRTTETVKANADSISTLKTQTPYAIAATASSANIYTATNSSITSYTTNLLLITTFNQANTGSATLNISSLGAKTLTKIDALGNANSLSAGDIKLNKPMMFRYNGSVLVLVGANSQDQINTSIISKSSDTTLLVSESGIIEVTTGSTNKTITLPTAIGNSGLRFAIKKADIDIGTVIIDGNASETIDGATTWTLYAQNDSASIISNGTNWDIIADNSLHKIGILSSLNTSDKSTLVASINEVNTNNIANTLLSVQGDLLYASAANTPARLAKGSAGQALIMNAGATAPMWADPLTNLYQQAIINGNFDVWQRGTSFVASTSYTADRWQGFRGALATGMTVSRQLAGLNGSQYCSRVQRDSGNTSTNTLNFGQAIETNNSILLRGKKVTLSFYARAGANFSAASNYLVAGIGQRTVVDENITAYSGTTDSINVVLTTSWQKFTLTTSAIVDVSINTIKAIFAHVPTGTAGAADYFELAQVQLCAGDVALPFQPKSFEDELRACQRHYYRMSASDASGNSYPRLASGMCNTATQAQIIIPFPVKMRSIPTFQTGGSFGVLNNVASVAAVTSMTQDSLSRNVNNNMLLVNVASGLTIGYTTNLFTNNDANAYIAFDAEL